MAIVRGIVFVKAGGTVAQGSKRGRLMEDQAASLTVFAINRSEAKAWPKSYFKIKRAGSGWERWAQSAKQQSFIRNKYFMGLGKEA
jgi:hypothetical protein